MAVASYEDLTQCLPIQVLLLNITLQKIPLEALEATFSIANPQYFSLTSQLDSKQALPNAAARNGTLHPPFRYALSILGRGHLTTATTVSP